MILIPPLCCTILVMISQIYILFNLKWKEVLTYQYKGTFLDFWKYIHTQYYIHSQNFKLDISEWVTSPPFPMSIFLIVSHTKWHPAPGVGMSFGLCWYSVFVKERKKWMFGLIQHWCLSFSNYNDINIVCAVIIFVWTFVILVSYKRY